jgi:acetyl esterase/lipase
MVDFTKQPLKGVYAICAIGFEIFRLPVYLVTYLLGFGRQHPKWTFRQAISMRVFSSVLWHIAELQVGTPLPLTPGAEKERFILIKPAKSDAYKGPLRSNKDVVPVEIGATWYPAPLTAGSDKSRTKVILHTHGGAFVHGDGRTQASGFMAKLLLKYTPATHILCPQYRLSTLPASPTSNPFPAALQDVLTSYLYLLNDLKIPAKNIIVSGDSAGGNLTIALLRYIAEYGAELDLPTPSAALLWSPWVDPSDTSCSYVRDNRNYKTDYLSPPFTKWGTSAYAGLAGEKVLSSPYIEHKYNMFRTPVPMWVSIGGNELLFFDVVEWAGKMREEGNDVVLDSEENVPHDILLLGGVLGFKEEAHNMAKMAGQWLVGE